MAQDSIMDHPGITTLYIHMNAALTHTVHTYALGMFVICTHTVHMVYAHMTYA
jgi:hypothetical protein